MKQFCRYSGLVLQKSTYLQNLGLPFAKLITPSQELVFSYSIYDILTLATHKPPEKLTATQRYLLTIAMLKATGTVKIKFPFSQEILTDSVVNRLWPALVESCVRIATNYGRWKTLLDQEALAKIEQRTDTQWEINWVSYVKDILLPNSAILLFKHTKISAQEKLADEIELEHELRKTILEHRHIRSKYQFTVAMGKAVLREINITLAKEDKPTLNAEFIQKCMHVFTVKPEQQKVGVHFIETLRNLIMTFTEVNKEGFASKNYSKVIDPMEDTILRSQISMTLGYLDAILDYFTINCSHLFGGKVVTTPAKLPITAPVQYPVKTLLTPTGFPESEVKLAPKNPKLEESTNPLIQKLLAKRKAEAELASQVKSS